MPFTVHYTFRTLDPGSVSQAWPLLAAKLPQVTWARWESFARDAVQGPAGVLLAERRGVIRAVVGWRKAPELEHGAMLLVRPFVLLEAMGGEALCRSLARELAAIAADQACGAVCILLAPGDAWMAEALTDADPSVEVFCQQDDAAPVIARLPEAIGRTVPRG